MKVEELFWKPGRSWQTVRGSCGAASLVIYFGSRKAIEDGARRTELRARFPEAIIIGCSTGGQIRGGDVSDEEVVAAAARFEHTRLRVATTLVGDCQGGSIACGQTLGAELAADDLAGVFVLSTRGTRLGDDDARCSAPPEPGLNWEFCNLTGRDLRGKDLSGINLRSAKLAGMDLSGAKLVGADLAYADLTGATLSNASLRTARLVGARFSAALLVEVDFTGADLSYADLSQARVTGSRFDGARFSDTLLPSAQPCSDENGKTACASLAMPRAR